MIQKTIITLFMLTTSLLMAVITDRGVVYFSPSNQSFTTSGFEENEYDYMLDPFLIHKLDKPWLFLSLDGEGAQFYNTVSMGWASGFKNNLNLVLTMNNSSHRYITDDSTSPNEETTYTDSNNTDRNFTIADNDIKLHTGLTIGDNKGIIVQLHVDEYYDTLNINQQDDTYDSAGTLIEKGDLRESNKYIVNQNRYSMDISTGLIRKNREIKINLGMSLINPQTRIDSDIYTYYNDTITPNTDATKRDRENIYKIEGQIDASSNTLLPYDTTFIDTNNLTSVMYKFNGEIRWQNDKQITYTLPVNLIYNSYSDLNSESQSSIKLYTDSSDSLISEDTTIVTNTLDIPVDFSFLTGFGLDKKFTPTPNVNLYLGISSEFIYNKIQQNKGKVLTTILKNSTDLDGNFDTDTISTTTQNGITINSDNTIFNILGEIATTYTPVKHITFNASVNPYISVNYKRVETIENSGNIYKKTDNINASNSDTIETKGVTLTDNDDIWGYYANSWNSQFGFTLNISENFKIDARSSANNLAFEEFSLMALFSY